VQFEGCVVPQGAYSFGPPIVPTSGLFSEDDGELGFAGGGGIDEGVAGAVSFGGFEEESTLGALGESGETGFAVDVGADFEVELAGVHESVSDVDFDFGGVNGGVGGVGDGEIVGAGADAAIDDGDGLGVGSWRRLCAGCEGESESKEN
jgi:hypothetical protein